MKLSFFIAAALLAAYILLVAGAPVVAVAAGIGGAGIITILRRGRQGA